MIKAIILISILSLFFGIGIGLIIGEYITNENWINNIKETSIKENNKFTIGEPNIYYTINKHRITNYSNNFIMEIEP